MRETRVTESQKLAMTATIDNDGSAAIGARGLRPPAASPRMIGVGSLESLSPDFACRARKRLAGSVAPELDRMYLGATSATAKLELGDELEYDISIVDI